MEEIKILCAEQGCCNYVPLAAKRRYCCTCRSRKYRLKYPLKYAYQTLKTNAKRRQKEFTLTLAEFKEFCDKTGYLKLKGLEADDMTIDRDDCTKGYVKGNLKMVKRIENVVKQLSEKHSFVNDKLKVGEVNKWLQGGAGVEVFEVPENPPF